MGFGLFVPEFREAFGLTTPAVGVVSSLGFFGFFIGLLLAQPLLDRRGPGASVMWGLAAATMGMGAVALAPGLPVLAPGVFVAATSAGLSWAPFNNAIHRKVHEPDRPGALSVVSTGTAVGIAAAGFAALLMALAGLSWRICWAAFAAASALAFLGNRIAFRGVARDDSAGPRDGWRALVRAQAFPVYAVAFAYGTTSAIYIAFAADHLATVGGVPGLADRATPAIVFICYGLAGLAGLLTGRAKAMIGLPMLLRLLMLSGAVSVALVALAPGTWAGLILSAALQGIHVMMTSAVLAFWTERLFPALPTRSFSTALLASAAGSVLGPAAAGLAAEALGPETMFLGTAALPALVVLLLRDRHARDTPSATPKAT